MKLLLVKVSEITNMSISDIKGESQRFPMPYARGLFAKWAKEKKFTLSQIGREINRGHAAVYQSIRKYNELMESNYELVIDWWSKKLEYEINEKNNRFAKIINVDVHQVLFLKDFEDDTFKLKMTTNIDGLDISVAMGYSTEESRNAAFDKAGHVLAKDFFNNVACKIGQ